MTTDFLPCEDLRFTCIVCQETPVECSDEICQHCRENEIDEYDYPDEEAA